MGNLVSTVDVLFKVALAVIAAYVSYQFSAQKQQNDDIKLVVELAFANEPRTATAGVVLAGKYAEQKRLPAELYASIVASANTNGSAALRETANNGADQVARTNASVAKQVDQAIDALPTRVYFHIGREVDRAKAKLLETQLEEQGVSPGAPSVVVPGIQLIGGERGMTEVRCFRKAECSDFGPKLVDFFNRAGIPAKLNDLSKTYENSPRIRANHFEVWFADIA